MQLAPLYPLFYQILKPTFPNCLWSGSPYKKVVALTFDDGPHKDYTPQLLQVLDRYDVPASFFWLGSCVARAPEVARAVVQRGHWIGLHGYNHKSFPFMEELELKQDLERTQMAIAQACNLSPSAVRDVRPPNGLFTPRTLELLQQWQYRSVMWSVVPEDWTNPGVDKVLERVLAQVDNGALIVLHDGFYGGENVAETTARLIPLLRSRGYEFLTVDGLRLTPII